MAAQLGKRKARPARYQPRKGLVILSGVFVACATVAVILGLFTLAGDRLGLWDPLEPAVFPAAAAAATALTFLGVAAFVAGAVLILWPLWAVGLGLVAGGYLAYRP